jgi:hypothetical protein
MYLFQSSDLRALRELRVNLSLFRPELPAMPVRYPDRFNYGQCIMSDLKQRLDRQQGKMGWILLWLLGVPIPVLLVLFLLRGCT